MSTSQKYWAKVIEKYFDKYQGLAQWHGALLQQVTTTGQIQIPSGRIFTYEAKKDYKGELQWPITTIKNYPVQGTGADVMSVCRVSFANRFRKESIKGVLVNTVHDDIVVDIEESEVEKVNKMFHAVFKDFPINFERMFKVKWDIPLLCEVSVGNNMKDLEEIKL